MSNVNLVDEATQWQHVGTVEAISERFLVPVLEALLQSYPFVVPSSFAPASYRKTLRAPFLTSVSRTGSLLACRPG
ncbi:MAG: hypothetical protein OXU75_13915 [Deltaproteobacteria bacterium]|nr:hypothetical protein [Deltaproteobacteria bacterium]